LQHCFGVFNDAHFVPIAGVPRDVANEQAPLAFDRTNLNSSLPTAPWSLI
jgi:hypothetical protein